MHNGFELSYFKKSQVHLVYSVLSEQVLHWKQELDSRRSKQKYLTTRPVHSNIISTSSNWPGVLFNKIQSVTNPSSNVLEHVAQSAYEEFLQYCVDKVDPFDLWHAPGIHFFYFPVHAATGLILHHNVSFHLYTDDLQTYLPVLPTYQMHQNPSTGS